MPNVHLVIATRQDPPLPLARLRVRGGWPDPEAEARFISEAPSAELVLVEDAGHYPQTEMPEQVTPAMLDFLARVRASKRRRLRMLA
jgi:pimeloyl-ACP methyl ester carboxylesterase